MLCSARHPDRLPRIVTIISLLFCFAVPTMAQNLVPNPGFEEYNSCPTSQAALQFSPDYTQFPSAKAWINPVLNSSSDYLNRCAPEVPSPSYGSVSVPNTGLGYQNPRTGDGMAGIITYASEPVSSGVLWYGEYIECRLTQKLKAGYIYELEFYVSFTVRKEWAGKNWLAMDRIGACFTNDLLLESSLHYIPAPFHVENTPGNFLTDTTNWIKISGKYKAKGGEEYMTLGTFNDGKPISALQVYPATPSPNGDGYGYYFIDDVSLIELPKCDTFYNAYETLFCKSSSPRIDLRSKNDTADTYTWNTGETSRSISVNSAGIYWCEAKKGCHLFVDTFKVKAPEPDDTLDLGPDRDLCKGQAVMIGTQLHGVNFLWSTGETACCIQPKMSGTYVLHVTDLCETRSDTVAVKFSECNDCMFIPSAFTPNNDGKNDRFGAIPKCPLKAYFLAVYNRWGQEVFRTNDVAKKWDGTYKNIAVDGDTYFYYVEYILDVQLAPKQTLKGNVILIR